MKANLIVIETDADHAEAKALVSKLMLSQEPDDALKITAQARLIEAYERNRWPRRTPEIADILAYIMDQHDLSRADMAKILGTPSRVSEVLTGKRDLSMTMVQRLRERFHVSADLLIPPVSRARKRVAA
jgi:HTH-type transcriptional regulator / antitoxin HigA